MGDGGVVVGDIRGAAKVVGVIIEDVGGVSGCLKVFHRHLRRFHRNLHAHQLLKVALEALVHLRDTGSQPAVGNNGITLRHVPQPACNPFRAIVVVLGVLAVLVEVDIGIRVEHRALQLQVQRFRLAVHPLVQVKHGELVRPCVGSVVAIIGKVHSIASIGLQVRRTVEQVMFRMRVSTLHFAFSQAAVDAESEGLC